MPYNNNRKRQINKQRRRRTRIRKIRALIRLIVLIAVLAALIFGAIKLIKYYNLSRNTAYTSTTDELNLKTLAPPDYVDVQLLTNANVRTGEKIEHINNIVIHYTGNPMTTAQNNHDYFDNIDTDVCSHFVVGLNGEIIQCLPLDEKSSASNHRNFDTISIEVCHSDETGKFGDKTYKSLIKLSAWLCNNSGLDETKIIRHYDITGKECPKYYVQNENEWKKLITNVRKELDKNYK